MIVTREQFTTLVRANPQWETSAREGRRESTMAYVERSDGATVTHARATYTRTGFGTPVSTVYEIFPDTYAARMGRMQDAPVFLTDAGLADELARREVAEWDSSLDGHSVPGDCVPVLERATGITICRDCGIQLDVA